MNYLLFQVAVVVFIFFLFSHSFNNIYIFNKNSLLFIARILLINFFEKFQRNVDFFSPEKKEANKKK
jgi:hypothetical protein